MSGRGGGNFMSKESKNSCTIPGGEIFCCKGGYDWGVGKTLRASLCGGSPWISRMSISQRGERAKRSRKVKMGDSFQFRGEKASRLREVRRKA